MLLRKIILIIIFLFSFFNFSENKNCYKLNYPKIKDNNVIMGNGYAKFNYYYINHNGFNVVKYVEGNLNKKSLDKGTKTTSCTEKYARFLEDDNKQNCDAGHILAKRLGGYGNITTNIFPQNSTINRGIYAKYEKEIYNFVKKKNNVNLRWEFFYKTDKNTMPFLVNYSVFINNSLQFYNVFNN